MQSLEAAKKNEHDCKKRQKQNPESVKQQEINKLANTVKKEHAELHQAKQKCKCANKVTSCWEAWQDASKAKTDCIMD